MSDSQALVLPYAVRFHSTRKSDPTQQLSFPAWVVHENADPSADPPLDQRDLWVDCHDEDNTAGLSIGRNWRADIGHGGPGTDASWSAFE